MVSRQAEKKHNCPMWQIYFALYNHRAFDSEDGTQRAKLRTQ